jgi:hypothetical protein
MEIPDLGTTAGVSIGVLFFTARAKLIWPKMAGRGTALFGLIAGLVLAFIPMLFFADTITRAEIGKALLTGLFGWGIAATAAGEVRRPRKRT